VCALALAETNQKNPTDRLVQEHREGHAQYQMEYCWVLPRDPVLTSGGEGSRISKVSRLKKTWLNGSPRIACTDGKQVCYKRVNFYVNKRDPRRLGSTILERAAEGGKHI